MPQLELSDADALETEGDGTHWSNDRGHSLRRVTRNLVKEEAAVRNVKEEHGVEDDDDEGLSIADSLDNLSQAATVSWWPKHMSKCNRLLRAEAANLDRIIAHCDNGMHHRPLE